MRNGESRDLQKNRPNANAEEKQSEHEQNVIQSLRQNMRVAEGKVLSRDLQSGRRMEGIGQIQNAAPFIATNPICPCKPIGATQSEGVRIDHQTVVPAERLRVMRHVSR